MLQALSCQHKAWWYGVWTHQPRDHDLSQSRTLNPQSHQAPQYTTSSLSIHLSMDILALSIIWLLLIVLPKTLGCMCPFESAFLYPLDKYLVVQLLGCRVVLFLVFLRNLYTVFKWLHQFAFPPTVQKCSPLSSSSPTSVVSWVVNFNHSDRCEVVSHCGFDLYFPDEWCWAFFHVSVSHLDVFFGEVSIHVFCPCLHWIICFFGYWVW